MQEDGYSGALVEQISLPFLHTQVLLLCVLAVMVAYTTLRHTRSRRGSPLFPAKKMRYSGIATWLLLITVPALVWVVAVAPYAVCYSSPAALVIGLALWLLVSFFMSMAALSDPGVILRAAPGWTLPAADEVSLTIVNGVELELKFCPTCGIVRPPRASHDRKTDRCVQKFDHFCVFIGNSVGRDNYHWFLCFIGLTASSAAFFVAYCLFHVIHLADRLEHEGGTSSDMAFGKAIGQAILSVVIGMYFAVMGTLVTLLFVLHCYLVSTGQTTSEFMKGSWKKTRNPFDKGLRLNWVDLLCGADSGGTTCTRRSKCDIIQPRSASELPCAALEIGRVELGEYVGTKIYSPRDEDPAPVFVTTKTPPGRVASAEFLLHLGDKVMATTLSEKMLKKSLHKALIDPFLKHYKTTTQSRARGGAELWVWLARSSCERRETSRDFQFTEKSDTLERSCVVRCSLRSRRHFFARVNKCRHLRATHLCATLLLKGY